MSTKEGGSLSLQMQCLWPSALQQPLEMTTPSSSFLEHADCTSVFPFQEKESERLEQGHMVLHLYFKVLKRLCFLFGFSGWVPVQNGCLGAASIPPNAPPRSPALRSSVNSFVLSSVVLCGSRGPGVPGKFP